MSEKMNIKKNKEVKLKTEPDHSNGGKKTNSTLKTVLIEDKKNKHDEMFAEKDKEDKSNL